MQVEGLQHVCLIQKKLVAQYPVGLVSPDMGHWTLGLCRDIRGMKSSILVPCFSSGPQYDYAGVHNPYELGLCKSSSLPKKPE